MCLFEVSLLLSLCLRFTPDFTASRVIRDLKLVTASGSEFVFVLNASLPYHMLAACAEALPRPNWELALYIIISGVMRYGVPPRLVLAVAEGPLCASHWSQGRGSPEHKEDTRTLSSLSTGGNTYNILG